MKSGQSIGLFTQREEIDIDFRLSGLPRAVVKQAENFRVRELVKKIESHPHRDALQADVQQNNVYNPFSDDSKAMIREMGNVEFFELCKTIPRVQSRSDLLHLWTSLGWQRIQSKCWSMAIGCPLHPARQNWGTERAFCGPQCAEEMYQKELWWNSRPFPTRSSISWFASQLKIGTGRPLLLPIFWGIFEISKTLVNKSGRNAPMRLRSDFRTAVTIMNRLHRESGEDRPVPIPFINTKGGTRLLPVLHGGSGMKTGGAHFLICRSKIVYSRWQSAAADGVCKQYTSHVTFFSCLRACVTVCHNDIGSSVCARHIIHVSCACVIVCSLLDPLFALFICLSHLLLHPPDVLLPLPCGCCREQDPLCTSPNEESGPSANNAPLTGDEPNFFDDWRISGRLWQQKYSKVEWNYRVSKRRNLSCSSRRRTTSTRSTTSLWTITWTKSRTSWSSYEKVTMRWKNWSDFKGLHSMDFREEH